MRRLTAGRVLALALLGTVAFVSPSEATFQQASVANFSTTNNGWTNVPGGTLTFDPAAGENWVLLFEAVLRSTSTANQAAEVRYLVDGTERGWGGIVNAAANAGGPWQSFYLVQNDLPPQTVTVQIRDATGGGATTTIDNLTIIAWRHPGSNVEDVQYVELNGPQAVPVGPHVGAPTVQPTLSLSTTQTGLAGSLCRTYWVMAQATAESADVRLNTSPAGMWPVSSGPGHWVNPTSTRETFFVGRSLSHNSGVHTYALEASGLGGGGTLNHARVLAVRTTPNTGGFCSPEGDVVSTFVSGAAAETLTTSTTPQLKDSVSVGTPGSANDFIVFQNILSRGDAGAYERRVRHDTGGQPTSSTGRVLSNANFYTSQAHFGAFTSATGFDLETFYSVSSGGSNHWVKESFTYAIQLGTASAPPTVPTNYRSIGTAADDSTGSITVTNGSAIVTGAGTSWLSGNRGRGDALTVPCPNPPLCTGGVDYTVLAVTSEGQLQLTAPFSGATTSGETYRIGRQFTQFQQWEDCIDGLGNGGVCFYFTPPSNDLVADNRNEVGIAYNDSPFVENPTFQDAVTGPNHRITLTVDPGNRHTGVAGTGVNISGVVSFRVDYITFEWLEMTGGNPAINVETVLANNFVQVRNSIIHGNTNTGLRITDGDAIVEVINNVFYANTQRGLLLATGVWAGGASIFVLNNTFYGNGNYGVESFSADDSPVLVRNNLSFGHGFSDFNFGPGADMDYNASGDATAAGGNSKPNLTGTDNVSTCGDVDGCVAFQSLSLGSENLHLANAAYTNEAFDSAEDLTSGPWAFNNDIDDQTRPTGPSTWDMGADEEGVAASNVLYRSVSVDGGNLNTGPARTVQIFGRTATFSGSMPDRVGVGDVLQYQIGSTWYLAFIERRVSSTEYRVATSTGADPQSAPAGTPVSVFRAYTLLSNWQALDENDSIEDSVEDFDTSRDLVSLGAVMQVACYDDGFMDDMVDVTAWTTAPANYIRIFTPYFWSEVGTPQRHTGVQGTGFYLRPSASGSAYQIINLNTGYVRIEGIEIDGVAVTNARYVRGIRVASGLSNVGDIRIDSCLIHDLNTTQAGFASEGSMGIIDFQQTSTSGPPMRVTNNIIYDITNTVVEGHIAGIHIGSRATSYVYNNTVHDIDNLGSGCAPSCGPAWGIYSKAFGGGTVNVIATNNYCGRVTAVNPVARCYDTQSGAGLTQSYNVASDTTASGTGSVDNQSSYASYFVSLTPGSEDLHLLNTSSALWGAPGTDLSSEFVNDIDLETRAMPWSIGADDPVATTEVELVGLAALPRDGAVDIEWQTGSELDNLGFHLYRSLSPDGLWTRITASVIPGLGSSPEGASYSFRDTGLQNGTTYYYRLEDIDSTSGSTVHGPVSATPSVGAGDGDDEGEAEAEGDGDEPDSEPLPERTSYGSPGKPQLRVLSRNSRAMVVELTTPGFVATDTSAGVRVSVRGFDARRHPEHPALPLKRALLNGVLGRHARVVWAREKQVSSFPDLVPAAVGSPEVFVGSDGTVQPRRREMAFTAVDGVHPLSAARIAGDAFISKKKKLALELSPLRYDAASRTLHLARKLQVKIAFDRQAQAGEEGSGSEGVRPPSSTTRPGGHVLAYLHTLEKGLHAVPYEALGLEGPVSQKALRLSLQGQAVPHRVAPASKKRFGPGSVLYFYAAHEASSLDHSGETTYALEQGPGGIPMKALPGSLKGLKPVSQAPSSEARFETNRFYQAGLLDAPDIWLWDFVVGGMSKSFPFVLPGLDLTASAAVQLQVVLQGASEAEIDGEHHLSVSVNGVPLGETTFDGKLAHVFTTTVPVSALLEGENTLEVTNLGDTGAYSFVFLDRFSVVHPRSRTLQSGRFEGAFSQKGRASLPGAARYGMDVTDPGSPKWVKLHKTRSRRTFKAQAGHRYVVASKGGLLSPRVSRPLETGLREDWNQADYVLIAPAEYLEAAEPLLERRESQGLKTRAVSFEEIVSQFGYGRPSAAAIRDFLAYAYHHWEAPRLKYVLLLGDASYDPRNFTGFSKGSPLPALWAKTSYLVTSSDPLIGAVNGEDGLADVPIGRLPALTVEEADGLIRKVLDWEDGGLGLGGKAILVADNPDIAGDFEWDIADIRESFLQSRDTETIHLSDYGGTTRIQVLNALDQGASLLSFVGHGGPAVWASENVLNSWDPPKLLDQPEQPLLLTFNCLNGYFVAPNYDSLAEAFMKAEGRGTIGAFSPSGLSLDGPAHRFHRAVMDELVNGGHQRLGDAVLAAQAVYAETGIMPELLAVYHLFADPAMRIR